MKKPFFLAALPVFLLVTLLVLPRVPLAQENSADEYWNQGNKYLFEKQWVPAINAYNKALALDPNHVNSYFSRGVAFLFSKQYEQAISDFTRTLELSPDAANKSFALMNRGLVYREKGAYDRALADFNKAIELKPDNSMSYYYKGSALDLGGRHAEALAALKEFVRMCPENKSTKPMIDNAKARIRLLEDMTR